MAMRELHSATLPHEFDCRGSGANRRGFLRTAGAAVGGAVLGATGLPGCLPPAADPRWHRLRVTVEGRARYLRVERRPRTGALTANEGSILRRYVGHGSPRVREAQLVYLARMSHVEEAFFHTLPDNLWTEVGFATERGQNRWQSHGVRILPMPAILDLWDGRKPGFPRPRRVINYHNHPLRFVRQALRRLGKPAAWQRLVDLPSAADLFVHGRLRHAFARRGTSLVSRVAIPDALVTYDVSPALLERIQSAGAPDGLRELTVYETARLSYAKNDISRSYFREVLAARLRQFGFSPDTVTLSFDHRVPTVG
jgi:hypothetical protein